jgi:hypothetical protein
MSPSSNDVLNQVPDTQKTIFNLETHKLPPQLSFKTVNPKPRNFGFLPGSSEDDRAGFRLVHPDKVDELVLADHNLLDELQAETLVRHGQQAHVPWYVHGRWCSMHIRRMIDEYVLQSHTLTPDLLFIIQPIDRRDEQPQPAIKRPPVEAAAWRR